MPTIMMDVRIYTLVHKELTGELSSAEALELSSLKNQAPVLDVAQDLSLIWNASKEYLPTNNWNSAGAKADLMQRIKADRLAPKETATNPNILKYASTAVIILALAALAFYFSASTETPVKETPKIENIEFASLNDNTKYWTEDGSAVSVVAFSDSERKVSLTGNAIFDVAKDPNRPFIIDMGEGVFAQVLGTSFKATSAHDGGIAKISVREGTVRLYSTGAYANEQILKAGQTGEINADGKNKKYASISPIILSSSDDLELSNIPLNSAFPLLGKYFGVTFDISNADLDCRYNNTLVQSQELEDLLSSMKSSYPEITIEELPRSHYKISGGCK